MAGELLAAETTAAGQISEYLRDRAAGLPVDSQIRSLALRSADNWESIAGAQRKRHLALATLHEFAGKA